uniref:Uncharacterized protein n=1 Tax=Arundo donax TaxID=35708 RepID=A0A0A9FUK2_ARUDO
MIITTAYNKVN